MEGVDQVRQLSDTELEWAASIGGVKRSWRAKIIEQVPDRFVAWTSTDGPKNSGKVSFRPDGPDATTVNLELDFGPEGVVEKTADKLGIVERRAERDLDRFRKFIEARGRETGGWRGEIHGGVEGWSAKPETTPGW
jgi:uncharacterized membrane protein